MESHPELVGDGLGGAIMVWADERSQDGAGTRDLTDMFGQRMTASGLEVWTPAARGNHPIAAGLGYQTNPHVVSDGRGGALVTWNELGPFAAASGRVQHLDWQGRVAPGWPTSGVALGLEVAYLVPDLDGGALAVWTDSSGAYLQRFESRWSPQGGVSAPLSLGPAAGRTNVRITSDGRDGAFMAWEERGQATAPGEAGSELKVRIQHLSFETRTVSPIVQLPTHDTPSIAFAVHPVAPNPARQVPPGRLRATDAGSRHDRRVRRRRSSVRDRRSAPLRNGPPIRELGSERSSRAACPCRSLPPARSGGSESAAVR
jgi:hypothetical protein